MAEQGGGQQINNDDAALRVQGVQNNEGQVEENVRKENLVLRHTQNLNADQENREPPRELQPVENELCQEPPRDIQITTGLKEYLQKTTNGKIIMKAYKNSQANNRPLKNNIKSLLTREIIGREKNYILRNTTEDQILDKFVIKRERFELLANEICLIFKGEHPSTYFTAPVHQGNQILLASGKLWNHYNYVKLTLREAQLLSHRELDKPKTVLNDEELVSVNENEDIIWLTNHVEPWDELINKWTRSFNSRRLMLSNSNLTVYAYIDKFPCLKIQKAKELFFTDFKLLYPDKQFIGINQWTKFKTALISTLESTKIKIVEDCVYAQVLKAGTLDSEKEDFIILYLLCHIVKPKRNGKRKNIENAAPRQLSIQERRETFILRVETANDVQPKLLDLKERYMQSHETFQPVIIAVGPVVRIETYYVVVNDQLYNIDTAIEAVDLALKVFFCLDCKYPVSSETIWVFIQRGLYNINLPFDSLSIELKSLLGHISSL